MKKIFILIVILFMFTGCGRSSYDEISYSELDSMIDKKEETDHAERKTKA